MTHRRLHCHHQFHGVQGPYRWRKFHRYNLLEYIQGEKVETKFYVDLMTTFGQGKLSRSFTVRYLMIDADTSYFALIGRKTLNKLRAILSTPHLKMKFSTLMGEIITIKED